MSILSKLFGGGAAPTPDPVKHEGFTITPVPQKEGGGFRIAATIEKDGKSHHLIRADVVEGKQAADEASIAKAKQMIKEQGDRLFD